MHTTLEVELHVRRLVGWLVGRSVGRSFAWLLGVFDCGLVVELMVGLLVVCWL